MEDADVKDDVKKACYAHVWICHAILTPFLRRLWRLHPRSKSAYGTLMSSDARFFTCFLSCFYDFVITKNCVTKQSSFKTVKKESSRLLNIVLNETRLPSSS